MVEMGRVLLQCINTCVLIGQLLLQDKGLPGAEGGRGGEGKGGGVGGRHLSLINHPFCLGYKGEIE